MNCQCRMENGKTIVCDACASAIIEAQSSPMAEAVELVPGMVPTGISLAVNNWLLGLKEKQDQPSE